LRWHLVEHSPSISPCSHILHTSPPSYSPQTHLNPIHFEWSAHEHTCRLQLQPHWHMHSHPHKINRIWLHMFLLHLSK
jgi:hypothetical protein